MVVKFPKSEIYHALGCHAKGDFHLSSFEASRKFGSDGEKCPSWKIENWTYYAPVTLSLKFGKKRVLIKGKLYLDEESSPEYGRLFSWSFTPNNRAKFLEIMAH